MSRWKVHSKSSRVYFFLPSILVGSAEKYRTVEFEWYVVFSGVRILFMAEVVVFGFTVTPLSWKWRLWISNFEAFSGVSFLGSFAWRQRVSHNVSVHVLWNSQRKDSRIALGESWMMVFSWFCNMIACYGFNQKKTRWTLTILSIYHLLKFLKYIVWNHQDPPSPTITSCHMAHHGASNEELQRAFQEMNKLRCWAISRWTSLDFLLPNRTCRESWNIESQFVFF